jgi:diadenosine tetraphosphate (Ap4A) HIT family hydrolase
MDGEFALALWDTFPLANGHTLVVPKRHVASLFDLPPDEQAYLWSFVANVWQQLRDHFHPDGFNVGVNDGPAAGQTVLHAHVHIIPRYIGDQKDPRGGIRWVIPDKARYWSSNEPDDEQPQCA